MLRTGFKNQERELSHILELNRVRENLLVTFLQRLTKAVQMGVTDPEVRHVLIHSLAFENADLEYKKIVGPLKVR